MMSDFNQQNFNTKIKLEVRNNVEDLVTKTTAEISK